MHALGWTRLSWVTLLAVCAIYVAGYLILRFSLTQYQFDKTNDVRISYTHFDSNRRVDVFLYHLYWPVVRVDQLLSGRGFDLAKW